MSSDETQAALEQRSGSNPAWPRRNFLKAAGSLPAAMLAAECLAAQPADAQQKLPQIQFGKHSISRLICGNNPFAAGSHLSTFVNQEMRAYYTTEQVLKTLRRCEEEGVNAWQATVRHTDVYRQHLDAGGKMKFMVIESSPAVIPTLVQAGCIAMAHHGEATDKLFKTGKLDQVNEVLKRVRDSGMLVGVSTHMPDVVDAIESNGWDVDYYMTCIYERHRSEADLQKLLGHVPLPVGEVYLKSDPPRMFKAVRQTKKTCLAFKILAAGRLCDRRELIEHAFSETFAAIKPCDGVIVGIYDRYSDQAAQNAALVRRFG